MTNQQRLSDKRSSRQSKLRVLLMHHWDACGTFVPKDRKDQAQSTEKQLYEESPQARECIRIGDLPVVLELLETTW